MVEIVVLPSRPEADQFERLRGRAIYHLDALHDSHAALRSAGFNPLRVPPKGVPDGAVLIVPEAPRSGPLEDVVQLMNRLLGPGGCPWDQVQTHESLKVCLLEETYEVLEAVDAGDDAALEEELGDLLLQPIMHAQIAAMEGRFDSHSVARRLVDKLIYRHPHVFGDVSASDPETVLKNWQTLKSLEKGHSRTSALSGIPHSSPALLRALTISKRAARWGFEWPDIESVWEKVREEEAELREAVESGQARRISAEMGDLLFTLVNVARWLKVDPEDALRMMLDRFTLRFQNMEAEASKPLDQLSADEWETLWQKAKSTTG